jgi:glucosamine--fructose-6-phosphate aminotransferase (isomerizing)
MEKEINEIPKVLNNTIKEYMDFNYMRNIPDNIDDIENIVIIGCGTAYHSGLIGGTYLQKNLSIPTTSVLASEFIVSNPIINRNSVYIFVSQSGETADTLQALRLVQGKCKYTIAITNVVYSTLAKSANIVLPVFAGPEIAVASTKAYNAQLLIFYLLSMHLKHKRLSIYFLNKLKSKLNKIDISSMYYYNKLTDINFDNLFILGKYTDYYTALEASLKLREITYHNISALPSGELKHGTLALINNNSTCIVIATNMDTLDKNINSIHEIKARGGKVILVSQFDISIDVDYIIKLPNIDNDLIDIVSVIPFQLLALERSIDENYNPDKPRNLAKSVTVE